MEEFIFEIIGEIIEEATGFALEKADEKMKKKKKEKKEQAAMEKEASQDDYFKKKLSKAALK